jgi:serine/threonine-protein kinase
MEAESWLVGRYQLCRQIGAGGVGQVWTAHDAVLGREVAVKVQQADPDEDYDAFERFVRESRSAAALQHPNVVTIFDSGTDGDTAFLVMELLPGPTLTAYLAEHGPLPEQEAAALAAQVAAGLAAAHSAGIVHRDIKPANLMFDARGTLKIVDFGIARLTQAVATRLTARNAVIGSPPYLSPEQVQGHPVDERSDLYCLGGVLMTMLTGRAPFEGSHSLALLSQHLHAAPPQVRDRRPDVDPALNALVGQMLSKSPQDRPQSAVEVLNRLTGSTPAAPAGTTRATTLVDLGPTARAALAPAAVRAESVARPGPRSLLGVGILTGAGAMAVVAALVVALMTTVDTPAAGRSGTAPTAPTAALTRSSEPPRAAEPGAAQPKAAQPSAAKATVAKGKLAKGKVAKPAATMTSRSKSPARSSAAAASRPPTTTPVAPRTADTSGDETDLAQALSRLRAAVGEVTSDGEVEAKRADDLTKRAEVLSQQLGRKHGAEATRRVDELDKYLAGLAEKGELTPAGQQRIATALSGLRDVVVSG